MKKFFKLVFHVALLCVVFIIGTILGGDKFGIGSGLGLVSAEINVSDNNDKEGKSEAEEAVRKTIGETIEKAAEQINETSEKVQDAVATQAANKTPEPTPHPYTTVNEIKITVLNDKCSFFSEKCEDMKMLEDKIIEAYSVNPKVLFVVDLSLASPAMSKKVEDVVFNLEKVNKDNEDKLNVKYIRE